MCLLPSPRHLASGEGIVVVGVRVCLCVRPAATARRNAVSQRITFKIALMTYDCIHGRSPVYFRDICSPIVSVPFRSRLRSADNDDMIVPRTRTARYGPRSFRVAAPQIWNMLPPHLKNSNVSREQFKSSLKTWLFVQAYS